MDRVFAVIVAVFTGIIALGSKDFAYQRHTPKDVSYGHPLYKDGMDKILGGENTVQTDFVNFHWTDKEWWKTDSSRLRQQIWNMGSLQRQNVAIDQKRSEILAKPLQPGKVWVLGTAQNIKMFFPGGEMKLAYDEPGLVATPDTFFVGEAFNTYNDFTRTTCPHGIMLYSSELMPMDRLIVGYYDEDMPPINSGWPGIKEGVFDYPGRMAATRVGMPFGKKQYFGILRLYGIQTVYSTPTK